MEIKKGSLIVNYNHSLWNNEGIVYNYGTIKNYIEIVDIEVLSLLARPDFKGKKSYEKITWFSDLFDSTPNQLSQLDPQKQSHYRDILTKQLNLFHFIIEKEEDESKKSMLQMALTFSDESKIYCGNDRVCIVEWGMLPKNIEPIDIYATYLRGSASDSGNKGDCHGNGFGLTDTAVSSGNGLNDRRFTTSGVGGDGLSLDNTDISSDDGLDKVNSSGDEGSGSSRSNGLDLTDMDNSFGDSVNDGNFSDDDSDKESSDNRLNSDALLGDELDGGRFSENKDRGSSHSNGLDLADTDNSFGDSVNGGNLSDDDSYKGGSGNGLSSANSDVPSGDVLNVGNSSGNDSEKGKPFRMISRSYLKWLPAGGLLSPLAGRNWWWWLLLLLFFILVWWLLKSCCRESSYLPEQPGVMKPIFEDDIVDSPDSTRRVVADRLNVLISEGGTVVEFAEAFKKIYPQKEYEIVYYDTLIPRAQIQFPREKREEIANELPMKLSQFELIIFDETLFNSNFKPQDSGFSDIQKSWYFEMVKSFAAWDITRGDTNIVVAVIDDGFELNHPELIGRVVKPYNSVTRSPKITSSMSGHGTHVASTAVGSMGNGVGVSGIAPGCFFMPIQVANDAGLMSTTAIIDAVLYAVTQGADVVNLSLGMQFNPMLQIMPIGYQRTMIYNSYLEEERVWNQIFAMAEKHNCTLVLAAGNENIMAGIDPMQRNPLGIKVAAIQSDEQKVQFSNYGEFTTVSAPGVQIYNAIPGKGYDFKDGTSMAAPIVTGGIALLKSKNSKLTTAQIIYILQSTGITSPSFIGEIIQLDKALEVANNNLDHILLPQPPVSGNPFQPPFTPLPLPNPPNDNIPDTDCEKVRKHVEKLQQELDYLRRIYADCLKPAETLKFDSPLTLDQLNGKWKSTTLIFNTEDQQVALYFQFDESNRGELMLVEPDGIEFTAAISLSVCNDVLTISQVTPAVSKSGKKYNPYFFTCRPNSKREAECVGINQIDKANRVEFKLISIN